MPDLSYILVDVFTDQPFGGNQLAVFADPPPDLDPALMQRIARELNLSESCFVLPPQDASCDMRLRIFTPAQEVPMAGHPTVGTGFVLHHLGQLPSFGDYRFEEGVGPIPVKLTPDRRVEMQQPMPNFGPAFEDRTSIAAMLSLGLDDLVPDAPIQVVSCGVPFLYVPLASLDALRRASLRLDVWTTLLKETDAPSVFVFTTESDQPGATVQSRMFAPAFGISEDPATGAASGPLGAYLVEHGMVEATPTAEIISAQGVEMGRPSQIYIRITREGTDWREVAIAGSSVLMGSGVLHLSLDS
jgi:trans-2,3-dihydro-3-hydroxyanthranilate isomerase